MICTGETYKDIVKMTFAKGAALEDPAGLFNSSLGGTRGGPSTSTRTRRSTRRPLKALVRAAVTLNTSKSQALIHGTTQRLAAAVASPWAPPVARLPHLDTCYWCSRFGSNA